MAHSSRWGAAGLVLASVLAAMSALPADAAAAPRRILFLNRTFEMDARYRAELDAAGFQVEQRPLTEPLSLADLKAFHLVILPEMVTLDAAYWVGATDVPTWWDQNLPNLRRYVASGGGLLVTTFFCEAGEALAASLERVLQPWGAGVRARQIVGPGHIAAIEKTGKRVEDGRFYCWTEQVARHPATAGVRRVYYPVCNLRWDDCYTTPPILLGDRAWTPLVRAMPGAYTTKTDRNYHWQQPMGNEEVLAAVRSVGRGRVAILSVNSYYTFFRPYTQEEQLGENHHGRIDGIPLSAGDGKTPSDLGRLLLNLYRWLAEPATKQGFGAGAIPPRAQRPAPTGQRVLDWDRLEMPPTWRHRPIPVQIDGQMYYDEQADPTIPGAVRYHRALIGVHSSFSDGKGSVADYAAAARKAGYSVVAFTERFEDLGGEARWERLRRECARCSTGDLVCLPGIDIADPEGGRYLIFGQPNYPAKTWLSPDGKTLIANNAMSLGFTTHLAAIARPQTGPHQYRLFKHYQGIAVATYRAGRLVDDGYEAYAWSVASGSNPIPLAVHEVASPAEVAQAARMGFQQVLPADTVAHAADYFRCAMSHFFDCPPRYFITEGPLIDTWAIFNKDQGRADENRDRYRIALGASITPQAWPQPLLRRDRSADVPLKEVALYAGGSLFRRWLPKGKQFAERLDGRHGWQHHWHLVVTDSAGRRAISPHLRSVPDRNVFRCGDRQNWLGNVGAQYTGVRLEWFDLHLPVKGLPDGDTTFPMVKGANLAPMLEFPLTSNRVCITDFILSQRYLNAEKLEDVAYDAAPMRLTGPSRLYEGKVRLAHFTPRADGPSVVLCHVRLELKRDVERADAGAVWPWFMEVAGRYAVRTDAGWRSGDIPSSAPLDLKPGDVVGNVVALSEGLRLEGGRFGLAAPRKASVPAGTSFEARFLIVGKSFAGWQQRPPQEYALAGEASGFARACGLDAPAPYRLELRRGTLLENAYTALFGATQDYGVAGEVRGGRAPFDLPAVISGLNPRWTAGVWRSDSPGAFPEPFGFVEGLGMTTLDVSRDARFFVGNLVRASSPAVFLNVEEWTKERIVVEANNPTDAPLTVTLETPPEVEGLRPLKTTVTLPAGTTVRVKE